MKKFKYKNILIIGFKKSGIASLDLLKKQGAFCYVFDDDKSVLKKFFNMPDVNIVNRINDDVVKIMDYVIISPSVSIFSEYVKLAKLYGVKVLSELELGTLFLRGKLIGITGTNGKTTTCSLIKHIFDTAKKTSVLCGNIGEPLCENILPFKTNYIVEMSSFQLESANRLRPNICAITNITPNHLDRHLNFKNYKNAKFNIFKNMSHLGNLILNYDDKTSMEILQMRIRPSITFISVNSEINGFFIKENKIIYKHNKKQNVIADISQTKLVGKHNLYNILIAVAICRKLKIGRLQIQNGINTFEPICHRLQFIKNVNGVDYVNDSKSTTPESTITAITAYQNKPLILILGGSDKETSFFRLAKKIKSSRNINSIIVVGATTKKIVLALKKFGIKNFVCAKTFDEALLMATDKAQFGDTVLLSPACASFDFFCDFEHRGDKFIEYVKGIKIEAKK